MVNVASLVIAIIGILSSFIGILAFGIPILWSIVPFLGIWWLFTAIWGNFACPPKNWYTRVAYFTPLGHPILLYKAAKDDCKI